MAKSRMAAPRSRVLTPARAAGPPGNRLPQRRTARLPATSAMPDSVPSTPNGTLSLASAPNVKAAMGCQNVSMLTMARPEANAAISNHLTCGMLRESVNASFRMVGTAFSPTGSAPCGLTGSRMRT